MREYIALQGIYRAYMRERRIGQWGLAIRLNNAWRSRSQKPRINWRIAAPTR